jgi:hypothetical protein
VGLGGRAGQAFIINKVNQSIDLKCRPWRTRAGPRGATPGSGMFIRWGHRGTRPSFILLRIALSISWWDNRNQFYHSWLHLKITFAPDLIFSIAAIT